MYDFKIKNSVAIIILLFLFSSEASFACTCIGENTVGDEIKSRDLVVTGKIVSKEIIDIVDSSFSYGIDSLGKPQFYIGHKTKYKVVVLEKFKGNYTQDTLTILTGMGFGDCGYEFTVGKNYVIYAYRPAKEKKKKTPTNVYETNICTRTMDYDDKEVEDIKKAIK